MIKKYKLLKDRFAYNAGTIVYDLKSCDYGLANDDSSVSGIEHISVTKDETGDYPFFTIPLVDLKEIK